MAHIKSTHKLLEYFKKRDLIHELNAEDAVPLNLETHHHHHEDDEPANTLANSASTTQRAYKTYSQR